MPATRSRQSTEKPVEEALQEVTKGEEGVEAVKPVETEDKPVEEADTEKADAAEAEPSSTEEKEADDDVANDDDAADEKADDDDDEDEKIDEEKTNGNGTTEALNGFGVEAKGDTEKAPVEKHAAEEESEDASPKKKVKTAEETTPAPAEATA